MELTPQEEQLIKSIYSMYDMGSMSADEALWQLEQLINGNEEND